MKRCMLCVATVVMAAAAQVGAATSISTLPSDPENYVHPFGEDNTATYGQTITAPAVDNVLDSFSFWLNDSVNPDYVDFAGYVMAWDGAKATGSVLWSSTALSTTNNGGLDGYEQLTFNTAGLSLTSGAQYVLFLNASNYFDGEYGTANMAVGTTTYDGGQFFFLNNGSDFSRLTLDAWSAYSINDAAFVAEFSSSGPVVPAPGAILLGVVGSGLVSWLRRRKSL